MAPVHFPTGSAYRLRERFRRHIVCLIGSVLEQGVTFSYHPERMGEQWDEKQEKQKSRVKRRNEREAVPIVKKGNWLR